MKKTQPIFGVVVALLMIISVASPVFAQSEIDPLEEPEGGFFQVNQLINFVSNLFNNLLGLDSDNEGTDPEVETDDLPDGVSQPETTAIPNQAEDLSTESLPLTIEDQITRQFPDVEINDKEIAKLQDLMDEATIDCTTAGYNCDLTLDMLMAEFASTGDIDKLYVKYIEDVREAIAEAQEASREAEQEALEARQEAEEEMREAQQEAEEKAAEQREDEQEKQEDAAKDREKDKDDD